MKVIRQGNLLSCALLSYAHEVCMVSYHFKGPWSTPLEQLYMLLEDLYGHFILISHFIRVILGKQKKPMLLGKYIFSGGYFSFHRNLESKLTMITTYLLMEWTCTWGIYLLRRSEHVQENQHYMLRWSQCVQK